MNYPGGVDRFALDVHANTYCILQEAVNTVRMMNTAGMNYTNRTVLHCSSMSEELFTNTGEDTELAAYFRRCPSIDRLPDASALFVDTQFIQSMKEKIDGQLIKSVPEKYQQLYKIAIHRIVTRVQMLTHCLSENLPSLPQDLHRLISGYAFEPLMDPAFSDQERLNTLYFAAEDRAQYLETTVKEELRIVSTTSPLAKRVQRISTLHFQRIVLEFLSLYQKEEYSQHSPWEDAYVERGELNTEKTITVMKTLANNTLLPLNHVSWNLLVHRLSLS
jgi:hypothetical protein